MRYRIMNERLSFPNFFIETSQMTITTFESISSPVWILVFLRDIGRKTESGFFSLMRGFCHHKRVEKLSLLKGYKVQQRIIRRYYKYSCRRLLILLATSATTPYFGF